MTYQIKPSQSAPHNTMHSRPSPSRRPIHESTMPAVSLLTISTSHIISSQANQVFPPAISTSQAIPLLARFITTCLSATRHSPTFRTITTYQPQRNHASPCRLSSPSRVSHEQSVSTIRPSAAPDHLDKPRRPLLDRSAPSRQSAIHRTSSHWTILTTRTRPTRANYSPSRQSVPIMPAPRLALTTTPHVYLRIRPAPSRLAFPIRNSA